MRFEFQISINAQWLADTLDRAGSSYWCSGLDFESFTARPGCTTCWEALLSGVISHVDVLLGTATHRVTRESIVDGIQLLIDKYPCHVGAVLGDEDACDAETGDALLQCAALGRCSQP